MTRISSLLVASTMAILPISAFAQQTAAPAKTAEPTGITAPGTPAPSASKTTAATTAPVAGKTTTGTSATEAKPGKPDVKTPATGTKSEVHGMNSVKTPHAKEVVPAKTAEPAKS